MKKGIIIEMKGRQKVILADNGRFYVASSKKGENIGDNVTISTAKKKFAALLIVLMFFLAAFYGGYYAVSEINSNVADTLIQLEINPSVEFLLNSNGKILSMAPLNEEAAIITANTEFKGMLIDDAVLIIIETSFLCGFINLDTDCNAVFIYSFSNNTEKTENINDLINNKLNNYFEHKFIKAVVLNNVYSPAVLSFASVYNCDSKKFNIIYTVSHILKQNGDSRTILQLMDDLKNKDIKYLLNIIRQAHIKYNQGLKPEKKLLFKQVKENFVIENEFKILSFLSQSTSRQDFNIFLQNKKDYVKSFSENNIAEFNKPLYLTEN